MEDASGKFALVMLRANQVRVHHKRTKHEYAFRISGGGVDVKECLLHPNPAAPIDPRTYREEAQAAAEWFIANRPAAPRTLSKSPPSSGWVAA